MELADVRSMSNPQGSCDCNNIGSHLVGLAGRELSCELSDLMNSTAEEWEADTSLAMGSCIFKDPCDVMS